MLVFVGSVLVLVLCFVTAEIIAVRKSTKDLERRIKHWRGRHGKQE